MATETTGEMNLESEEAVLRIRFDGPALATHEMDVAILAPSLQALGELCVEANQIRNGNEANLRVMLRADIKANCVTFDLSLVQHVLDGASVLLEPGKVASATAILTLLGLITGNLAKPAWSLLKFLLWRKNKATDEKPAGNHTTNVFIIGNEAEIIEVDNTVIRLANSAKAVKNVKKLVAPVQRTGIEEEQFIYEGKPGLIVDEKMAKALQDVNILSDEPEPQKFTAHIVLYSPILDEKVRKWRFKLNGRVETIDISETTLAADALARGALHPGDTWKVLLEVCEKQKASGGYYFNFKVLEVQEFMPGKAGEQMRFPVTAEALHEQDDEEEDKLPPIRQ